MLNIVLNSYTVRISFLFLLKLFSYESITLREKFFVGIDFREFFFGHFAVINFRELGFAEDFAGINFLELSLTNDFAGINFRESALFKDFTRVNFTFALRKILSMASVYGFKNNLGKN